VHRIIQKPRNTTFNFKKLKQSPISSSLIHRPGQRPLRR